MAPILPYGPLRGPWGDGLPGPPTGDWRAAWCAALRLLRFRLDGLLRLPFAAHRTREGPALKFQGCERQVCHLGGGGVRCWRLPVRELATMHAPSRRTSNEGRVLSRSGLWQARPVAGGVGHLRGARRGPRDRPQPHGFAPVPPSLCSWRVAFDSDIALAQATPHYHESFCCF